MISCMTYVMLLTDTTISTGYLLYIPPHSEVETNILLSLQSRQGLPQILNNIFSKLDILTLLQIKSDYSQ